MSIATLILGNSGSGKSTSLRNLDPERTLLIQCIKKPLPFRSSGWKTRLTLKSEGNVIQTSDPAVIEKILQTAPHDIVVVDDYQAVMVNELMNRSTEKGYEKFTDIGKHAYNVFQAAGSRPEHRRVYILAHTQTDDFGQVRMKTVGKMVDQTLVPEGYFTIVLRTEIINGQYERQVSNSKLSPSTYVGYKKAITGERMRRWHSLQVREVTPSMLREWVAGMDCTSKAIRNMLTPLRSVFDDALNDELIDFNPFDRIALAKLIRQTAKASDYVVSPFSAAERTALLEACRPDERPMLQFWFSTGLRPGELQALQWRHIDWGRKVARIEQNQVAGVIKTPKTAAGIRAVDLDGSALAALQAQRAISEAKGPRIWLNPRDGLPWSTDAQVRKTFWLPVCTRSGVDYRNPYQVRHTYASTLLTDGHNPWYVAAQLGHEDVEMVFRTYGRFIREDYQKPKPELRIAASR